MIEQEQEQLSLQNVVSHDGAKHLNAMQYYAMSIAN